MTTTMGPGSIDPGYRVTTVARLRETIGDVPPATRTKLRTTLDPFSLRFIESSPYVCIASHGSDGRADTSPRGDEPGFVKALDDQTLVMPERPGNRLADTLSNIREQPGIGMLFLVPGCPESLRVNGTAEIHDGPSSLLQMMGARGRIPKLAIVVRVAEVYMHCGRAATRSRLWDPTVAWNDPRPDLLVGDTYGLAEEDAKTLLASYNQDEL
jgi:uncharacterized protein